MNILKAIKSTFEAIGMTVFIYVVYVYFENSEVFLFKEFLLSGVVAIFVVWLSNKALRWMGKHNELEECPYCGAELDYEVNSGTWHETICNMDIDTMGEFLMDWGLACVKNEEPKDIFKWLEEKIENDKIDE